MLSLLAAMPSTLQSVELRFLVVLGEGSNYRDLLSNVCNLSAGVSAWRTRDQRSRHMLGTGIMRLFWKFGRMRRPTEASTTDGENPISELTAGPGSNILLGQKGVQR